MSDTMRPEQEKLFDFEIQRVTTGLSDKEMREYEALTRSEQMTERDRTSIELTVAVTDLSIGLQSIEPLPSSIRDRLLIDAGTHFAAAGIRATAQKSKRYEAPISLTPARSRPLLTRSQILAYAIAASCLGLAFWFGPWNTTPAPTVAQRYAEFMSDVNDVETMKIVNGSDPWGSTAHGEIAWSNSKQMGYMKLSDLHINDPAENQYQLWIFQDPIDQQEAPVDGGVFDIVKRDGDLIEFKAKTTASRGFVFVVTIEDPGGVPRSNRERIAAIAVSAEAAKALSIAEPVANRLIAAFQ